MIAKTAQTWLARAAAYGGLILTIIYGAFLYPNYNIVEYIGYILLVPGLVWLYVNGSESERKSIVSYAITGGIAVAIVVLYIYLKT